MSSVFPSRSASDAPQPSAASQVPFLKNVSKSMKHKPEIIRKIARTASAKNSLDLNRPSHEQIHHYDSNPSLDGRDSIHKLNRSGSSLSAFSSTNGGLEIGSRQRGLAGIGRGASYHARSTSGTSGISAWSSQTRESGGTTPVGGSFRHPWQQTPTIQRESFTGSMSGGGGGGGSYNEPNSFSLDGRGGSDEDLRERERELAGRRSLQLGGGYGLGLDGVDEGYERPYERSSTPAFERPAIVRSNTSATVHSAGGRLPSSERLTRQSYRQGESRTYTPISQLPPPLAGSHEKGRGMGGLRVNTSNSGMSVAGVAGRGAGIGGSGVGVTAGNVTPGNGSASRLSLGAGGSNPEIISASALPHTTSNPVLHNSANQNSTSTNGPLYNTAASSSQNLHLSTGLNNSTGHVNTPSTIITSASLHPDTSTTSPISTPTFEQRTKTRPSFEMHLSHRLRGKSEPKNVPQTVEEAKRIWNEKEARKTAEVNAKLAKKVEEERVKEEKRRQKLERRGRTSTASIGSFALGGGSGRGRADTGATAGTQATYSTAYGSSISGVPRHSRHGSGATARQNSGIATAPASYQRHSYHNSYDADDLSVAPSPAFLDTGEMGYAPSEAEIAAAAAARTGGRDGREGSPKVKEVKEKIYAAKSKSHSAWASFMLWFKTRILKLGRSSKKIVKGKKSKAQ